MCATVTKGGTLPDSANKADFYTLIDSATVTSIGNNDIAAGASIADTKLAQITTASKVSGTALTGLASIPAGAGVVPVANLGSGTPGATNFLRGDGAFEALTTTILPAGTVLQIVNTQLQTQTTCADDIPRDNTKPQITEGTEILSRAITASHANNLLKIDVVVNGVGSDATASCCVALFKVGTADALACSFDYNLTGYPVTIAFTYWVAAGATTEQTFTVRVGGNTGTAYVNTGSGSTAYYNGTICSSITITEVKA